MLLDETSIIFRGNLFYDNFCANMSAAFFESLALKHKLPAWVFEMQGASGKKYRSFINNLVEKIPDPRYLEVGSYAGSTVCSAAYKNKCEALCIDNWSQFGGPKDLFVANVQKTIDQKNSIKLLEADFRRVNYESLGKYNVYLFDGPHEEIDQYDGIVLALPALSEKCILIVDDWNWPDVRKGTIRAISDSKLKVNFSIQIRTTQDDAHAKISGPNSDWHNGYFICAVEK